VVKKLGDGLKVLGGGELKRKITVRGPPILAVGPGEDPGRRRQGGGHRSGRPVAGRRTTHEQVLRGHRQHLPGAGPAQASLFTLALLAVYRIGGHIPTPGVDAPALRTSFEQNQGTVFGFIDLFSGGMFRRLTIFALGIMPYITASIILQLLTVVIPTLEKLQKEGELGRRKITQWTRYLTILFGLPVGGIAISLQQSEGGFVLNPGIGFILMTMLTLTTGTAFIMWLGEQISDRGIGNGMSLIIFAGIVVGIPNAVGNFVTNLSTGQWGALHVIIILIFMVLVVAFIVLVERGERRIPVQYAKRVVGRRMMGGQATHLPLKVNAGGVIPVIFASSVLAFPQTLAVMPAVKQQPLA
jgi:preprotein translocase subunit SecY